MLFPSRFLIALLIPVIVFSLGVWFLLSNEIDRNEVRVAGTLVGAAEVELYVQGCSVAEKQGTRRLTVTMEARNIGDAEVNLNPGGFQLLLARKSDPATRATRSVFNPMHFTSSSEDAPDSVSRIPPAATRRITLVFWGQTLPRGDEWEEHFLSLEYYDPATPLMLSKILNPVEE